MSPITVKRSDLVLHPDRKRVLARPFRLASRKRSAMICAQVMALSEDEVRTLLGQVEAEFGDRHVAIREFLSRQFDELRPWLLGEDELSTERKLLLGAYFTHEYSIEAAALFNPSMVPAFDQSGLPEGSLRFLMSLRATGEGHISSIVFRRGVIDRENNIIMEQRSPYNRQLKVKENRTYFKETYSLKLREMEGENPLANAVLERLQGEFTFKELCDAIEDVGKTQQNPMAMQETEEDMISLARANYQIEIPEHIDVSAAVIFPHSENESRGVEDVRLVRFIEEDGTPVYYGTYTAFNGFHILPQMFEVRDASNLTVHTLTGKYSQNKGMALFPRKVGGHYVMSSRIDNENLYIMKSDNVLVWNQADLVQTPQFPWELVQLGNCGSPLETEAGWLLLTHGVGPMRQYCIGATLLDLDDPTKVIGQTREPLMVPQGKERSGYVPNVVYSCGGMIHNDILVIPYAMSDISSSLAIVPLDELLDLLTR